MGLDIDSIRGLSSTRARIYLAFDGTDFDAAYPGFNLQIDHAVLIQSETTDLNSGNLLILSYTETPVATLASDSVLTEYRLGHRYLTLTLTEEEFINYATLSAADFILNNEPAGMSIESVTGIDLNHAQLDLAFDYNDFDDDVTDFSVSIVRDVLVQTNNTDLLSNALNIVAYIEIPQLSAVEDTILEEYNLDGRKITLALSEDEFTNPSALTTTDFSILDAPDGMSLVSLNPLGVDSVELFLGFDQTDFDVDYNNFRIGIDMDVLLQSELTDLISNTMNILRYIETPVLTISEDSLMHEKTLDRREIHLSLDEERFIDFGSIVAGNFELLNAPTGLSIDNVTASSLTEAVIHLAFDGTDFDALISDLGVRIDMNALYQSETADLVSQNTLSIYPEGENPIAVISASTSLEEISLDDAFVDLQLAQEDFWSEALVIPDSFALVNAPAGLSIENIVFTDSRNIRINFAFDGTDFDADSNNFSIVINRNILVQSAEDLATNTLPVLYNLEPVIRLVSIPDDTMKVGDLVTVDIQTDSDLGNTFTLHSGSIGSFSLTNLQRQSDTMYSADFLVAEGGTDYAAGIDIPVSSLQLYNGPIPGNTVYTSFTQDNDLLDANSPVIENIIAFSAGQKRIGDEIFMLLTADQSGYSFTDSSTINGVLFSGDAVNISSIGAGNYNLNYKVEEGHSDVDTGNLALSIVARDIAGNLSVPFTSIALNDLSIDASRPEISRAYVSSTDTSVVVDEIVEIIFEADQTGYIPDDETWVNAVNVNGFDLTFEDLQDSTYRMVYTVSDQDGSVSAGDLAINIVLIDAYGNVSRPFNNLDPNNVTIHTNRPSALITGSDTICYGDTSLISVRLGGMSPWDIVIQERIPSLDQTRTWPVTEIRSYNYEFEVIPALSTDYTIPRVNDSTGNTNNGVGLTSITVNPLPVVEIQNLKNVYNITAPPVNVQFSPAGGVFSGPGIIHDNGVIFHPDSAGVSEEGEPHDIVYWYMDQNGCINTDTSKIIVIDPIDSIRFESPVACFNDREFTVIGENEADSTGSWEFVPNIDSVIVASDTNSVTLDLTKLKLSANMTVQVIYYYTDPSNYPLSRQRELLIEYLDPATINPVANDEYCRNYDAIDLDGYYGSEGRFYGHGITNDSTQYRFDPAQAIIGTNLVGYYFTSDNNCRVGDSIELTVFDAPVLDIDIEDACIPQTGGAVTFLNHSYTGESQSVDWDWNFGDINSGSANFSTLEAPVHVYSDAGTWSVNVSVTIDHGCSDALRKDIVLHANPVADFTLNSNCISDEPITLRGTETLYNSDEVSGRKWAFTVDRRTHVPGDTARVQQYDFRETPGKHTVQYMISTDNGCADSIEQTIDFSPTFRLAVEDYSQDFEGATEGWLREAEGDVNSWTFGSISGAVFPYTPSGTKAWYTVLPNPIVPESSWVLSPCFNFEDYNRPMVSIDLKRSLDRDRDGAVLQYTLDNGKSWNTVGTMDDGGQTWYNSTRISPPGPGNQSIGWTGTYIHEEEEEWHTASHALDMITGEKEVRFRMAYGSTGANLVRNGIAFDNFRIRKRTRLTLLEYFTNANDPNTPAADEVVKQLWLSRPADVIDVQYHSDYPSADRMNIDNPIVSSTRGLFYGNSRVPFALLDGGPYDEHLEDYRRYDFNSKNPSVEDIHSRSLTPPEFNISINISQMAPAMILSVDLTALKQMPSRDLTLYTLVVQDTIDDPDYVGTNGQSVFRNVAKKLVEDASGENFSKAWSQGESVTVPLLWSEIGNWVDPSKSSIVAFVQDDNTREILQAATTRKYVPSTGVWEGGLISGRNILLYPNPAPHYLNVYFEHRPEEALEMRIINMSGRTVITERIPEETMIHQVELNQLPEGLYILELRTERRGSLYYRDKFFHNW